jgi:hypothetical protein
LPKQDTEADDTEKIEEMISEKPKKPKANTNANKKKADTSRDSTNESNSNSNSNDNSAADDDTNKKDSGKDSNPTMKKQDSLSPATKPQPTPATGKPAAKTPGGETRPRQPVKP